MLLKALADKNRGSLSSFCVEACIGERKFWKWVHASELMQECYAMGKMIARENWEEEGREIQEIIMMPGTSSYRYDVWKMRGWSQFGIGKVNKIRLKLEPNASPNEHYHQLIKQASEGDFTASWRLNS